MREQTQDMGLTINDIQLAVQVIDVAAARGAIRGEEMAAVGILRQRLTAFLSTNEPAPKVTEEAPAE
jgi:hypothetical protein